MKENPVKWFGYLFSFAFLIISCTGTELTQKQVDDAYKGKPVSDILVIAITGNEHINPANKYSTNNSNYAIKRAWIKLMHEN